MLLGFEVTGVGRIGTGTGFNNIQKSFITKYNYRSDNSYNNYSLIDITWTIGSWFAGRTTPRASWFPSNIHAWKVVPYIRTVLIGALDHPSIGWFSAYFLKKCSHFFNTAAIHS